MVRFALRSLLYDRARLAIAVGGVGFAVLLVLTLRGIFDGTIAKSTLYTERVGADLFVTQAGVEHMALATPLLPGALEDALAAVPGVAEARGIVRVPAIVRAGGADISASVVGFDVASGFGGPWSLAAGTARLDPDGVVLDTTLAAQHGLRLGDTVTIADHGFRLEGLSRDTNALALGRDVFVDRDVAAQLFLQPGIVNFVLVKVAPGADPRAAAAAIVSAHPELAALLRDDLVANDRALFRDLFGVPVNVMAYIGLAVGLLVIGLATYAAAVERAHDFGVLKAIGASNLYLYRVVIEVALGIGVSGFVAGLVLAVALGPLIVRVAPELGVTVRAAYAAQIFVLAVGLSLVSALLPVRRVAGLDPKEAFA